MTSVITGIRHDSFSGPNKSNLDGIVIELSDSKTIKLGIENYQNCCETWGYFTSNDDPVDFIGAEILSIKIVDTCLNVDQLKDQNLYEPSLLFVNIDTTKGTWQFTAYNDHNGYYGHAAYVISDIFNYVENL